MKEFIKEIFDKLQIEGDFELSESEDVVSIVLDTKDSGVVIGYHGETLEALQIVLSLALSKKMDKFIRVSIEVGDYKKNRTDWLESIAARAKEQVLLENREVALPALKSWERRIVHMMLQNDEEVTSESVGEGKNRTLIVKPRT